MLTKAELPQLFLQRLRRLAEIRGQRHSEFNREGLEMIDRAIFSTYRDCRKLRVEADAREILREAGVPVSVSEALT
ncbi:MAG: hypothetical protein WEB00_11640 [Dehalococcoidia bacterium]